MVDNWIVYIHISPSLKYYFGITKYGDNPNRRWQNGKGYKNCTGFLNAINK